MKETTSIETGYLCHCLRISAERFNQMLAEERAPNYAVLRQKSGIGTMCSSCEYEAKGVLNDYLLLHPEKAGRTARSHRRGLRGALRSGWKQFCAKVLPPLTAASPKEPDSKTYHTGIFFLRRSGLESRLVLSNLKFPEHPENRNGSAVRFRGTLFGEDGSILAVSGPLTLADGDSRELSARELFPTLEGDFIGGLYLDFEELALTGSLRPYGILVDLSGEFQARCHYHDKFGRFVDPGYFQNTAPLEPGQRCWMALSNCQNAPYEAKAWLQTGGRKESVALRLAPMASLWVPIEDLFPDLARPEADRCHTHFWLDNPQHAMVYFFWFHEEHRTWMGQHH